VADFFNFIDLSTHTNAGTCTGVCRQV